MYDDLLGKKRKTEKGIVIIEDCDWDDENKKVIVKKRTVHEIDIEVDENGVVKWIPKEEEILKN